MHRAVLFGLALLAAAGCTRAAPAADANAPQLHFPPLTGRVVDQAGLLTSAEAGRVAAISADIERRTKAQYVVVTLKSLEGDTIEDYGVRLGRSWGVGRKGVNDGLLLIVAPAERRVRIEVGYGLERRITDPYARKVIDQAIVPAFKRGDFAVGIREGSLALERRILSRQSDAQIYQEDHRS